MSPDQRALLPLLVPTDHPRFHALNPQGKELIMEELAVEQGQGRQPGTVTLLELFTRRYGWCSYDCASHGHGDECDAIFPEWFWAEAGIETA